LFSERPRPMNSRMLVVGLGNPGSQYQQTAHNLGFKVLDELAVRLQTRWAQQEGRALVALAERDHTELVLVKPQTWMNLSGRAVKSALERYDFALNELVVICDDLALPFGKIRIRAKGSAGGHNGLKSIIESVGSNEFVRVRLGILPEVEISDAAEYVLSPIAVQFETLASTMVEQAGNAALMIAQQGLVPAMNYFNSLSVPEKIEEA
jgi:PTH1 family peptidyl-tRNA hydrolase